MLIDLDLKKFKGNRVRETVTDLKDIVTGLYELCIEGKEMNIKILEKTTTKIQRKEKDDNETKINPNYFKLSKSLINVQIYEFEIFAKI